MHYGNGDKPNWAPNNLNGTQAYIKYVLWTTFVSYGFQKNSKTKTSGSHIQTIMAKCCSCRVSEDNAAQNNSLFEQQKPGLGFCRQKPVSAMPVV